jgi:hypothetical protein
MGLYQAGTNREARTGLSASQQKGSPETIPSTAIPVHDPRDSVFDAHFASAAPQGLEDLLKNSGASGSAAASRFVLQLQRRYGNRHVQRMFAGPESARPLVQRISPSFGAQEKSPVVAGGGLNRIQRKPKDVHIGYPVEFHDDVEKKNVKLATRKAREIAQLVKNGKWTKESSEQLAQWLEFFQDSAQTAFTNALEFETGAKEYESESEDDPNIDAATTRVNAIIPLSEAQTSRGGFKVQYAAQIYNETSDSTSVEVYTDLSLSAGLSAELPLGKYAKFKIGGDAKRGRKSTEKNEQKHADRRGTTISKSFTVQRIERQVVNYGYRKTYFAAHPIAEKVTYEDRGAGNEIQHGYKVIDDQGGKPWGPFWNPYVDGVEDEKAGLAEAWQVISALPRTIAEDLVLAPE